jgi:glutathione synthase/RimK-type ligase-like ATP-grasp enzyme
MTMNSLHVNRNGERYPRLIGLPTLMKMAVSDVDLTPMGAELLERAQRDADDANALMDLSTVLQLRGERDVALAVQGEALKIQRMYRYGGNDEINIRVLVIMGPGDLMANMPIEFLVEGSDVALFLLYVAEGEELPAELPEHDLVFVALAESDQNHQLLLQVDAQLQEWPTPVLNTPSRITHLSRDGACGLLQGLPGVLMPLTVRMERSEVERLGSGAISISSILADGGFPVILRPVDSHAGHGLAKLDDPAAVTGYLATAEEQDFYISRFVDYSGPDGMFRKCRVALIEGRSYVGHMAVSARWMVHYLNADMLENASNREEEERFMTGFDEGFALRHAEAFQAITRSVGLEYLGIDCAETRDGDLLIFEIDNSMVVHAMDPVEVFPYKQPTMRKLFGAFRQMLVNRMKGDSQ